MRHPPRVRALSKLIGAAIAAFGLTVAAAATVHTSVRSPAPPQPPARVAPQKPSPSGSHASAETARPSAAASVAADHRHRDRDDVIVFDDPFWDPFWDLDADLVLGYTPYAYPPRPWMVYGPTPAAMRRGLVPVELHVHPWKASVIVDDSVLGEARDYNDDSHPLFLAPGKHDVELRYPGYESLRFEMDVQKGLPRDLHYSLIKGQGMDPRSSEATPAPTGRG